MTVAYPDEIRRVMDEEYPRSANCQYQMSRKQMLYFNVLSYSIFYRFTHPNDPMPSEMANCYREFQPCMVFRTAQQTSSERSEKQFLISGELARLFLRLELLLCGSWDAKMKISRHVLATARAILDEIEATYSRCVAALKTPLKLSFQIFDRTGEGRTSLEVIVEEHHLRSAEVEPPEEEEEADDNIPVLLGQLPDVVGRVWVVELALRDQQPPTNHYFPGIESDVDKLKMLVAVDLRQKDVRLVNEDSIVEPMHYWDRATNYITSVEYISYLATCCRSKTEPDDMISWERNPHDHVDVPDKAPVRLSKHSSVSILVMRLKPFRLYHQLGPANRKWTPKEGRAKIASYLTYIADSFCHAQELLSPFEWERYNTNKSLKASA